jgi:endonuclease YncB( thermonuclease family)
MFKKLWTDFLNWLTPKPLGAVFSARICNVIDADSLQVRVGFQRFTLRLVGVDGPEYVQEYGREAFQYLVKLAYQHPKVTVQRFGKDKYGRMLARVTVGDTDLALGMLQAGFAWHLPAYSQQAIPEHAGRYGFASHEARQARRGLWAGNNPMHPAQFRAARRIPARIPAVKSKQLDLFS